MTESVENLLLEHLKALRNELREFRNEFHSETENLKQRMSALETAMINVIAKSTRVTKPMPGIKCRSTNWSSAFVESRSASI